MSHPHSKIYRLDTNRWSTERAVFLVAGILIATATLLGFIVHPWFHCATVFFGGMLIFFAITGYCPMAMIVDRILKR